MSRVLLGPTLPGRYPRWGYLDRLETNAAMPRACVAALACMGLLGLCVLLVQAFHPAPFAAPEPHRPILLTPVHMLPAPLPPPPLVTPAPRPRAVVQRPPLGAIVPVDESIATDFAAVGGSEAGSGEPGGDAATPWDGGLDRSPIILEPPTPESEAFVVVEHEPELVFMRAPGYPDIARDAGIEGTVLVRALVGADGTVRQALVLRSVTGLDEAALAAATTAVFRPARQQGLPVAVWVVIPIQFSLRPCP